MDASPDPRLMLREDLSKEYYAILALVSSYDGWLLIVKGWSVTLSLAGLGVGFQQGQPAIFGLAALTAASFWFLDGLMKGYQYRFYVRMREIEYSSYLLNAVRLEGEYQTEISAPRIDMSWGFKGFKEADGHDWRSEAPKRRSPQETHADLRSRFWWPNVALPHVIGVLLGTVLFAAAAAGVLQIGSLP